MVHIYIQYFRHNLFTILVLHNIYFNIEDTESNEMQIQDLPLACNFWFHSELFIILAKAMWVANTNNVWHGLQMINHTLIQPLFLDWTPETQLVCAGNIMQKPFKNVRGGE